MEGQVTFYHPRNLSGVSERKGCNQMDVYCSHGLGSKKETKQKQKKNLTCLETAYVVSSNCLEDAAVQAPSTLLK